MAELQLERTEEALARALDGREAVTVICYTPFGIVRGILRRASPGTGSESAFIEGRSDPVIGLHDAVVEHYSSHLPTGLYKVFYLSLKQVSGYVLVEN